MDDTTRMAIPAPFSCESQNSFEIPMATTVPSDEIAIVTTVVQMRLTISSDSFFSLIFLSAFAQNLRFLIALSMVCCAIDMRGISVPAKKMRRRRRMRNEMIDPESICFLL